MTDLAIVALAAVAGGLAVAAVLHLALPGRRR